MKKLHSILPEERGEQTKSARAERTQETRPTRQQRARRGDEHFASRPARATSASGNQASHPRRNDSSNRPRRKRSAFNVQTIAVLGAFLVLLFILIPTALTLRDTHRRLDEAKAIQSSLEEQRGELETSVADLKSQLDIVNTDAFIAKYAHEKLGMVRPNEILIRMEDGEWAINSEGVASVAWDDASETSIASTEGESDETEDTEEEVESAPEETTNDNAASEWVAETEE